MPRLPGRLGVLAGRLLLPLTVVGLVAGLLAAAAGNDEVAWWCWTVPSVIVGARLTVSIVSDMLRGKAGVDVIAVLAIGGARAMRADSSRCASCTGMRRAGSSTARSRTSS